MLVLMKLFFIVALLGPSFSVGQTVNNVRITAGQPYRINNPTYPNDMGWQASTLEWNLQVEEGAYIKFVCRDIRMTQMKPWADECVQVYLSVDGGEGEKKVCGSTVQDFLYKSKGAKLKIVAKSTTEGTAMFNCFAMNMGDSNPAEVIKMDPHGHARKIEIMGSPTPLPYLDKLWILESPPGTRMSFQCEIGIGRGPECGWNVVIFNNGETDEEICDMGNFVWFSKVNKAKLRIQLDENGYGWMKCLVQAVTGPKPDEYENVAEHQEVIDSSEYGVTPGSRKTSCNCGWANKGGARIIRGNETKPNEFPWMVHLYLEMDTPHGYLQSTCGASILTPRHVLSAAHCVVVLEKVAPTDAIKLILSKHDTNKPTGKEVTIGVEKIFVRDIYLKKGLYFDDITLIYTKETIEYSSTIGPICIEPKPYSVINKKILAMGWGWTENNEVSSYLRKGNVVVMDPVLCGAQAWEMCVTTRPSSICSGDSGSPLVWLDPETNRYSQISLSSRGSDCFNGYMITTLVAHFYDWIQQKIKETEPTMQTCHKI